MRILINAVNVASAGGRGVLTGLVPALSSVAREDEITVLMLHNSWGAYRLPRRQIGSSLRDQLIYATYYPARFRRLWPRLARVIVQTPVMGDRLRERFGVPQDRITVIPPGCLLNQGGTP